MKTLIYGAGPIGRWLAFRLAQAGADVTVLARGTTYEIIEREGIVIVDGFTGESTTQPVKLVRDLAPDDVYDLVLVAMRGASRLEVCPALAAAANAGIVVFIGNGVTGFDRYFQHLPPERVLLGFATVAGGMDDGQLVMVESGRPKGAIRPLSLGELGGPPGEACRQVARFLKDSGVPVSLEDDIDGWLKYHFAFIGPTAGVIMACDGDLGAVACDPEALRTYQRACRQAGDVLAKLGHTRRQPLIFNLFYWLPEFFGPWVFKGIFGSRFAQVGFGLHMNNIGNELAELTDEFLVLKARAAIPTPDLDALLAHIPRH